MSIVRVNGLANDHMASLVGLWFELNKGDALDNTEALRLAANLHGHPVAAKLAANLVAQSGVDHLLTYPNELLGLRRDLAKKLIIDLNLSENTCDLMEVLSVISVPVPSKVLVGALATDNESFQNAVADATGAGIAETTDSGWLTSIRWFRTTSGGATLTTRITSRRQELRPLPCKSISIR